MGIHFVATGGCSGFSYKQLYTAKALRQTQGVNTAGDWDVEEERGQRGLGRVGAGTRRGFSSGNGNSFSMG